MLKKKNKIDVVVEAAKAALDTTLYYATRIGSEGDVIVRGHKPDGVIVSNISNDDAIELNLHSASQLSGHVRLQDIGLDTFLDSESAESALFRRKYTVTKETDDYKNSLLGLCLDCSRLKDVILYCVDKDENDTYSVHQNRIHRIEIYDNPKLHEGEKYGVSKNNPGVIIATSDNAKIFYVYGIGCFLDEKSAIEVANKYNSEIRR